MSYEKRIFQKDDQEFILDKDMITSKQMFIHRYYSDNQITMVKSIAVIVNLILKLEKTNTNLILRAKFL